ncbi:hypothetical protein [Mumia sp. DW29H23]|uniref:hypothetical protein n=1 Tax=Mumia sp. DW29H23 TaxID=3421241 RepID=UPI003D696B14
MPLQRRRTVVTLYQGDYEQRLADLGGRVAAAFEAENETPRRLSDESDAAALAQEHDDLRAEADETAEKVTLFALTNTQWVELAAQHPPRDDDKADAARGVNTDTFPGALLLACLVPPPDGHDRREVLDLLNEGQRILDTIGDPTRVQWLKLTRAAYAVNMQDDDLPKVSLVSALHNAREAGSGRQSDSGSAPDASTGGSQSSSTSTSTPTDGSPERLA